ncbi:peroxiredoxin family protein [Candidatus Poribacteria bacterium]|nr:peroxiredoxin family protein [Candidatus Poribacteria bacterium]MBT5532661.1 peroxiredoxin family protein [Candidatus Poribacteria bacterium]MBT5709521.1 peroxiredoxin family protein [Candidatus Poribacteria bacterium]MBT7100252.1 peroxiredoxin family protein [Candidatus Poribacteria bacterium]MBT7803928.1 peroxiredoxin family protein [Candidatus Poribacteria bacterium]
MELQESIADFDANGIGLLAISVDPPATAARMRDAHGLTYPLLSDPDAATIVAYDVKHPLLRLALPAVFVLDSQGVIRWEQIGAHKADRALTADVIAATLAIAESGEVEPTPRAVSATGKSATTWARLKGRD